MEEVVPKSLDLFSVPPVLLSINDVRYEKINTKTALGENVSQLEFTANADKVHYTNLKETYFMIRCKYEKSDGSQLEAAPKIGPIQNLLTSLMKSVDFWINDQKCTPNESCLPYINFLHLFTQSQQAKDTVLTTSLWYEDTYTSINTASQPNPQATEDINHGLKKRADFFGSSEEVTLIGKIFIGPHNTDRLYLPNLKFDWKVELTPMAFFSMTTEAATAYKFRITEAAILLNRVSVNPSVALSHASLLQSHNALYPCMYSAGRTFNIAAGSYDFVFSNAFVGKKMPISVFVFFVDAQALSGSLVRNPYVFYPLNLQKLTCRLGAKQIPAVEYKLNVGTNNTQFALWETFRALDYIDSNSGPGNLNRQTFDNGLFIYGFDLSNDGVPSATNYSNSNFEATNLSFLGSFSQPADRTYTCKLYNKGPSL